MLMAPLGRKLASPHLSAATSTYEDISELNIHVASQTVNYASLDPSVDHGASPSGAHYEDINVTKLTRVLKDKLQTHIKKNELALEYNVCTF